MGKNGFVDKIPNDWNQKSRKWGKGWLENGVPRSGNICAKEPTISEANAENHENMYQWIGLRESLQETIDFSIKYGAFL